MKNRTVTLLDLGLDSTFTISTNHIQQLVQALAIDEPGRGLDLITVQARDVNTIRDILTRPSDVLHMMGHAGKNERQGASVGTEEDDLAQLEALRDEFLGAEEYPISAEIVIIDGCNSCGPSWRRLLRDVIGQDTLYVGTGRRVGWRDGALFATGFYAALTQKRGKGWSLLDAGEAAVDKANSAIFEITGARSPYRRYHLTPSRAAQASLREAPLT